MTIDMLSNDVPRTECPAVRIAVLPHDNADALELAAVGGYRAVVVKGRYQTGDLVVYVPEGSVVPGYLQERLGLTGRLAGSRKNRVKAIRLRGVLSQGLIVPLDTADGGHTVANGQGECRAVEEGDDVAAFLGVEKYVPPVPTSMAGAVWPAGQERTLAYDIENVKRWPDVLADGEPVVMTEKVHGTLLGCGVLPPELAHPDHGRTVVFSKGLGAKGLAFDMRQGAANVYTRAVRDLGIAAAIERVFADELCSQPVFVLGEVFGPGVQDLTYGGQASGVGVRVFDICVGQRSQGTFLDDAALDAACQAMGVDRVPVVYRGPYSGTALAAHTDGRETVSGSQAHLREGVVVRSATERVDPGLGRVQLKSVSDDYLTRKGGTEYT